MVLIDVRVPTDHIIVIRCDIKLKSVEKCGDVEMSQFEPISGKKLRVST
jgi:hypothetical protein